MRKGTQALTSALQPADQYITSVGILDAQRFTYQSTTPLVSCRHRGARRWLCPTRGSGAGWRRRSGITPVTPAWSAWGGKKGGSEEGGREGGGGVVEIAIAGREVGLLVTQTLQKSSPLGGDPKQVDQVPTHSLIQDQVPPLSPTCM